MKKTWPILAFVVAQSLLFSTVHATSSCPDGWACLLVHLYRNGEPYNAPVYVTGFLFGFLPVDMKQLAQTEDGTYGGIALPSETVHILVYGVFDMQTVYVETAGVYEFTIQI